MEHIEDCQRMNIDVIPPNINQSDADFSVQEGRIHFGLSAIKGCSGAAEPIVAARKQGDRPFSDLFDFCERVESSSCNRSAIETLIKAGAFDSFGAHRAQLTAAIDRALQAGASALADRRSGQKSLFGDMEDETEESTQAQLPDVPEWDERERLLLEREVLGYYLSSHPLAETRTNVGDILYPHHVRARAAQGSGRSAVGRHAIRDQMWPTSKRVVTRRHPPSTRILI